MHPAVAAYEAAYVVADPARIGGLVAEAFSPGGTLMSPWLESPVVGHEALAEHVTRTRARIGAAVSRHTSVIDRVGNVLRWTWEFTVGGEVVSQGMDVAVLAEDGRMDMLVVFDGSAPAAVDKDAGPDGQGD